MTIEYLNVLKSRLAEPLFVIGPSKFRYIV